jgi:hypothetical protein
VSELVYADAIVASAPTVSSKENIATRRTVVYQTLMDPTLARIAGEKAKHKLFRNFLFKLTTPDEIEFVSIQKYYEPYIVISGKYSIDYYRKCAYSVNVDKEAREVVLLGQTFTPRPFSENNIKLEGEERLIKETRGFIILNRYGEDSKLSEFPSAPSEENPQKLIKAFKIPEIAPDKDLSVIRKKIMQRPADISRLVNEELEIDERSIIYTPRFKLTYKCPRIGKQAYLEFDGVTLKQIQQNENPFLVTINAIVSIFKRGFDTGEKWIIKRASIALEKGKILTNIR